MASSPEVRPVEMVVFTPRRLCTMAVWPAAALITVLEKSIGLAYDGPASRARRSNSEIVCTLQNIVPRTRPTSSPFLISADHSLSSSASCAAEATNREVLSKGRRFLEPRYFVASKSVISLPSGQPNPSVSKSCTGLSALRLSHNERCRLAGESPSDETTPMPVMTTVFLINLIPPTFGRAMTRCYRQTHRRCSSPP